MITLVVTGTRDCDPDVAEALIDRWARGLVGPHWLFPEAREIDYRRAFQMIVGDNSGRMETVVDPQGRRVRRPVMEGVDLAARRWARRNCVGLLVGVAHWFPEPGELDRGAGHARNEVMARIAGLLLRAREPVRALALPGPNSTGTPDMIGRLRGYRVPVDVRDDLRRGATPTGET